MLELTFDSCKRSEYAKNSVRLTQTQKTPVLYSNIALESKLPRDMDSKNSSKNSKNYSGVLFKVR